MSVITTCPECGVGGRLKTRWETEPHRFGERVVPVRVPVTRCEGCGFEFYPPEAEGILDAIVKRISKGEVPHE